MKKGVTSFITAILICLSCQKDITSLPQENDLSGYEEVTVRDPSFSWCKPMFYRSDTKYLDPVNLSDYIDSLVIGKRYFIKYDEVIRAMSSCTGREKIKILEIRSSPYPLEYKYWPQAFREWCTDKKEVTFQRVTGTDGCGFLFQQVDNKWLEPVNKKDFLIDWTIGKKYWLKYEITYDWISACDFGNKDLIIIADIKDY